MDMTGNTILVTGGATGIGRALAERLLARGNRVIAASRSRAALEAAAASLPGLEIRVFDVADAAAIPAFASELIAAHPDLNVLVNNAGIMRDEDFRAGDWLAAAEATIETNLLGPLRLTSALLPHLLARPKAAVLNVTSGLAFVPKLATPTYSATKAALHSLSLTLRRQLRDTSVEVIEIAPPYVQTELQGPAQAVDPHAMPLAAFADEVMAILSTVPTPAEVIVERCRGFRSAEANGKVGDLMEMLAAMVR